MVVGRAELGELDTNVVLEESVVTDEALEVGFLVGVAVLDSVEIDFPGKQLASVRPRQHQPTIIDTQRINLLIPLPRPEITLRQLQIEPPDVSITDHLFLLLFLIWPPRAASYLEFV